MSETSSSYRQIIKATSLFGGVQFFSILISIVRSKIVAVLLGASGVGLLGLLISTLNVFYGFLGAGLETSGVKSISETAANANEKLPQKIAVLRKIGWISGVIAMLLMLLLSSFISQLVFNSDNYTIAVIWLAVALLFKQLTISHLAVLQGLRQIKDLAKANLFGNLFGLVVSVPLYFYFGEKAVSPSVFIASLSGFLFAWLYNSKNKISPFTISNNEAVKEGKDLIRLGFMLSLSSLTTLLAGYLLQIFINYYSGVSAVGFYTAGFAILYSYVGLIFSAMATDYFPRLSAISNDSVKINDTVNQQAFVAVLLVTPIIVLFLIFLPVIVTVLYTSEFKVIIPMLAYGILGMLFRAVSWSMGFILLAKGDSKVFIKTAIGFNALQLAMNILSYVWYGLEGLGISFAIYFFIHFLGMKLITDRCYDFKLNKEFYRLFFVCLLISLLTFLGYHISNVWVKYPIMVVLAIISVIFTLHELHKKVDLKEYFHSKKLKND